MAAAWVQASTGTASPDTTAAPPTPVQTRSTPPPAAPRRDAGVFAKGHRRLSITGGWGQSFGDDYLLLGVGAGYFLADGLDVGVDFEAWLIGDPTVYKLSPRVDYVLWKSPRLKPYFGGFYRRSFITDYDDLHSLGGRAGAYYRGTRGGMVGAAIVYERYLDCEDSVYSSCDDFYPEIFFAKYF